MGQVVKFIKKKGSAGPLFQLTPALEERLKIGDFEFATDEEIKAIKLKSAGQQGIKVQRFVKRKGVPNAPLMAWTVALAASPDFEEVTVKGKAVEQDNQFSDDEQGKPLDANLEPPIIVSSPENDNEADKPQEPVVGGEEAKEDADDIAIREANRRTMIVNIMRDMDPETEYTVATPLKEAMPKVDILSEKIGFKVSAMERNAAWDILKEEG